MALNSSRSITVNIQSGNRYIGEGAVEATIVDDDCKWIYKLFKYLYIA